MPNQTSNSGARTKRTPATPTTELRAQRKRDGLCPRCGSELEDVPEINQLTGAQLRRDGELVSSTVCQKRCGYTIRPYANRRKK